MRTAEARLEFPRRAKVRTTELAVLRRFPSACGRYAIVESRSLAGAHAITWLSIKVLATGEFIIGRSKVRASAEQVCIDDLGDQ